MGQLNRLFGGVGTASRHDGHATCRLLHRHADDFAVFVHVHRGGLAGRADHADAVCALSDMPINQATQRRVVHGAIVEHGGHQRDDAAPNGSKGRSHGATERG